MPTIHTEYFDQTDQQEPVECFVLRNDAGMVVKLVPIGASVQSLIVPDKHGQPVDIALGYDHAAGYLANPEYLGCTVGRCANRITGAQFDLEGETHALSKNAAGIHLHGGATGISRQLWTSTMERSQSDGGLSVSFYHESPDGEDGYPGKLSLRVRYTLDDNQSLHIEHFARTDQPTIVNLCNHSYFNLNGHDAGSITDHELRLFSEQYTPTNDDLLPTGELADLTPVLDFRKARRIGEHLNHPDLAITGGYDHNFVIPQGKKRMTLAAIMTAERSGILMSVSTTEPAMQLYTANHLALDNAKGGGSYLRYEGVCLETQRFPDAINQPNFPSVVLAPDDLYYSKTVYRFGRLKNTASTDS
ncbi:MAG: aldose epimerase family protein [Woeseiaceae bacterium]